MHIRAVTMAEKPTSLIAADHVLEGRHTRLGLVSSLLKRENLSLSRDTLRFTELIA